MTACIATPTKLTTATDYVLAPPDETVSPLTIVRAYGEGTISLGGPRPHQLREHDRFQPAWWEGAELTRTAAPVWVPACWQHEMLLEADVVGETTANRRYKPLCE